MTNLSPVQLIALIIMGIFGIAAAVATGFLFLTGQPVPSVLWGLDGALLAFATHALGVSSGVSAAMTPSLPVSPLPQAGLMVVAQSANTVPQTTTPVQNTVPIYEAPSSPSQRVPGGI